MYNCPFSIAPMMGWSDRHCRYFHRLLTRKARLYSEMIVADALIHGDQKRHLQFDPSEHPLALQLGGSDPDRLAKAARIGIEWGYDEINLNAGCPSDRVRSGAFGACLMREPELVGECVHAIKQAVNAPVTVKCRLGVDEQDIETALAQMAQAVFDAGCDALWVHARKAWLKGLSPKENREVPPLDYERVIRLKRDWPQKFIGLNGGLLDMAQMDALKGKVDGFMMGRGAYQNPAFLLQIDSAFFGLEAEKRDWPDLCDNLTRYIARHQEQGGRAHNVTRHLIGLFQGRKGARSFRQILTVEALKPECDGTILEKAFAAVLGEEFATA